MKQYQVSIRNDQAFNVVFVTAACEEYARLKIMAEWPSWRIVQFMAEYEPHYFHYELDASTMNHDAARRLRLIISRRRRAAAIVRLTQKIKTSCPVIHRLGAACQALAEAGQFRGGFHLFAMPKPRPRFAAANDNGPWPSAISLIFNPRRFDRAPVIMPRNPDAELIRLGQMLTLARKVAAAVATLRDASDRRLLSDTPFNMSICAVEAIERMEAHTMQGRMIKARAAAWRKKPGNKMTEMECGPVILPAQGGGLVHVA